MIYLRRLALAPTVLLFWGLAPADPPQRCVASLQDLRVLVGDSAFPLRWEETSMTDGKPLVLTLEEREGALFLEFVKTREGLWAQGPAKVCAGNEGLQARIGRISFGPAAHWILRRSAGQDRTFALSRQGPRMLQVATLGWAGTFQPRPD